MTNEIKIFELKEFDEEYLHPIRELLLQLSSSPIEFTENTLRELISSENSSLFVAEYNNKVCGMLTLANYIAPTGRKLWIEDVVVDTTLRGKSIGRSLIECAINRAKEIGGTLMLTSKPARIAANALYRSAGFKQKETNVYIMKL